MSEEGGQTESIDIKYNCKLFVEVVCGGIILLSTAQNMRVFVFCGFHSVSTHPTAEQENHTCNIELQSLMNMLYVFSLVLYCESVW